MASVKRLAGIALQCPMCGAVCGMTIETATMEVTCGECSEVIDAADAGRQLRHAAGCWDRFYAWLQLAGRIATDE
jgi:transcription elongation factor Elf1